MLIMAVLIPLLIVMKTLEIARSSLICTHAYSPYAYTSRAIAGGILYIVHFYEKIRTFGVVIVVDGLRVTERRRQRRVADN